MRITTLLAFAVITLAASTAEAKHYRYIGAHPLSADVYCYIEAPHVHVRPPYRKVLFRVADDHYYFVGDPVAHGDDRDRHVYHGHHPIDLEVVLGRPGVEFCYIDGPHHHRFAPPRSARFEHHGGIYWYVGTMPTRYHRDRTIYAPINAEIRYTRPVVTIQPPRGYVELHVGGPHLRAVGHVPHVRPVVEVNAPRPRIVAPAPRVHVHHEPRVVVDHRRGRGYGHGGGKYEHKVEYKDGKYEEKYEYKGRGGKVETKYEYKDGKHEYKHEEKRKHEHKRERGREHKRGRDRD